MRDWIDGREPIEFGLDASGTYPPISISFIRVQKMPNRAPIVNVTDQTVLMNATVVATDLFSVSDPDSDPRWQCSGTQKRRQKRRRISEDV